MTSTRPVSIVTGIGALMLIVGCGPRDGDSVADDEPAIEAAAVVVAEAPATTPSTISPEGASVFFITPADGDTVSNPVAIEFGIEGMDVVAAGVNDVHSGHHHLLVDTDSSDMGLPIPADANHIQIGRAHV